jgi:hypothetical protein
LLAKALPLRAARDEAAAIRLLDIAIELDPGLGRAYYERAQARATMIVQGTSNNQSIAALTASDYEKAVELGVPDVDPNLLLYVTGVTFYQATEYLKSTSFLSRAIQSLEGGAPTTDPSLLPLIVSARGRSFAAVNNCVTWRADLNKAIGLFAQISTPAAMQQATIWRNVLANGQFSCR